MTDTRTLFTSINKQTHPLEANLEVVPDFVSFQELKTYILLDGRLKVVTRARKFIGTTHEDNLTEEIILDRK